MAIPGDNFVLRLHENEGSLIDMNVLDLANSGPAERAALVEWAFGLRANITQAGFSIIRFNPLGNVLGQVSKTLCSFSNLECGNFQLETGILIPAIDGFIVAGTATNIFTGVQNPIAIRIDNAGNVRWAQKYVADVGHPTTAKITSMVAMQAPDRYLISALSSDDETWLFQIDGNTGMLTASRLVWYLRIRRLRMTTLGILAVGETNTESPEPVILALDPMTAAPLWQRTATWEDEGGDIAVRWFDIAEGDQVLLVVGNVVDHLGNEISPRMAFLDKYSLPTPGDFIKIFQPADGHNPVRLRAVINHQDLVIPLTSGDVNSAFCVTGDVNNQPWSFAIVEDQTLLWQKRLRTPAMSQGREVPVIWPSFEEIITAGFSTTGSTPRGFIASSSMTNGRGFTNCSEQTDVKFPEATLYAHRSPGEDEPLTMRTLDWSTDQGQDVDVKRGCLDTLQ